MNLSISVKELLFGSIGVLVGGVFVWSLTSNIDMRAQLKAIEKINPLVTDAVAAARGAETASQFALNRASNALSEVSAAETEVKRVLTNLNATPLFKNIDDSIAELRTVAATVAREEASVDVPVGTILAWHKSLENTPNLPDSWVELNGQRLDDTESVYHNRLMPKLNIQAYAGGRGYYLRGGLESGQFNDSTYWTDNTAAYGPGGNKTYYGASYAQLRELDSDTGTQNTYGNSKLGAGRRFQTAAMTVVWIMKIK